MENYDFKHNHKAYDFAPTDPPNPNRPDAASGLQGSGPPPPADGTAQPDANALLDLVSKYNQEILDIALRLGKEYFPDLSKYSAYVDNYGRPVPQHIARAKRASASTFSYEEVHRLKNPDGKSIREKYARAHEMLRDTLVARYPDIASRLLDLAMGLKAVRRDKNGVEIEVYDRIPDLDAIIQILDRTMGKPEQFKQVEETKDVTTNVHLYMPDNGRDNPSIQPPTPPELPYPVMDLPPNQRETVEAGVQQFKDRADAFVFDEVDKFIDLMERSGVTPNDLGTEDARADR